MGLLARIFGRATPQLRDAEGIYAKLMTQSRHPAFFGNGKITDSYDGRIELLTLHMTPFITALRKFGPDGALLSQALYDVMRDDFDIALREEGISDTGVARRIKPMMTLFFTRVRDFDAALQSEDGGKSISHILSHKPDEPVVIDFANRVGRYSADFYTIINGLSLEAISQAQFNFPELD